MSTILRQASQAARRIPKTRAFTSSSVSRSDIVQNIYLREIKGYKPSPAAKDAHVGAVKQYSLPPNPKVPALPTDLAAELAAYDATEPTAATEEVKASPESTEASGGAQEFLSFLEQDPPKPGHH